MRQGSKENIFRIFKIATSNCYESISCWKGGETSKDNIFRIFKVATSKLG